MKSLIHPHIIRLYEVCQKKENKSNINFLCSIGNGIKESHLFSNRICNKW
jgi:hypothetical protein